MTTYADMQARIADEIQRSDLTTQIQNAIQSAIQHYERKRFYFNELFDNGSWSTVLGQEFYSGATTPLIYTMASIDTLTIFAFNNRYKLQPRSAGWIEDLSVGVTWNGMPTDWCYVGEQIRMYPIPNAAYPVLTTGTQRLVALIQPTDYNAWTIDAEVLIRSVAKRILFTHVLYDQERAGIMVQEEQLALAGLQSESSQRVAAGGRIRPSSYF